MDSQSSFRLFLLCFVLLLPHFLLISFLTLYSRWVLNLFIAQATLEIFDPPASGDLTTGGIGTNLDSIKFLLVS